MSKLTIVVGLLSIMAFVSILGFWPNRRIALLSLLIGLALVLVFVALVIIQIALPTSRA